MSDMDDLYGSPQDDTNERKCNHCDAPIKTPQTVAGHQQMREEDKARPLSDWWQAWLAGFCSPRCHVEHTAYMVVRGEAWWQR